MSTNALPVEKRIAVNLPIPEHPPIPSPEKLENLDPDEIIGFPPQTRLLLEGSDRARSLSSSSLVSTTSRKTAGCRLMASRCRVEGRKSRPTG